MNSTTIKYQLYANSMHRTGTLIALAAFYGQTWKSTDKYDSLFQMLWPRKQRMLGGTKEGLGRRPQQPESRR